MTDNEALEIAKKQLSQAIHLSECGVNDGIRAMYEDKAEWLCSLIGCINRQKAEIERLTEEINALNGNTEKYIAECEKRSREIAEDCRKEIKSESIREFAEKLKAKSFIRENGFEANEDRFRAFVAVCEIDNLVKEMTEESNDQQKT